jgi:hypothetical protein
MFERDRIGTREAAQTVTFRDFLRVCGATVWLSEHVLDRIASVVGAQWSIGSIGNGTGIAKRYFRNTNTLKCPAGCTIAWKPALAISLLDPVFPSIIFVDEHHFRRLRQPQSYHIVHLRLRIVRRPGGYREQRVRDRIRHQRRKQVTIRLISASPIPATRTAVADSGRIRRTWLGADQPNDWQ